MVSEKEWELLQKQVPYTSTGPGGGAKYVSLITHIGMNSGGAKYVNLITHIGMNPGGAKYVNLITHIGMNSRSQKYFIKI